MGRASMPMTDAVARWIPAQRREAQTYEAGQENEQSPLSPENSLMIA
jgi:hypothetical protein